MECKLIKPQYDTIEDENNDTWNGEMFDCLFQGLKLVSNMLTSPISIESLIRLQKIICTAIDMVDT